MDIEKVKELALINGFKLKEQASGNMDLNAYVYDFANAIEREVRAQADQKVKLLLCDEHLKKCESPTGIFNSQYSDEEPCLICLAKEAKAQVVPEWISVEDELPPTDTMVLICWSDSPEVEPEKDFMDICTDTGCPFWANYLNDMPTHWMPLPDAPQEPAND